MPLHGLGAGERNSDLSSDPLPGSVEELDDRPEALVPLEIRRRGFITSATQVLVPARSAQPMV